MPQALIALLLPVAEKLLFRIVRAYVAKELQQYPEILAVIDEIGVELGIPTAAPSA